MWRGPWRTDARTRGPGRGAVAILALGLALALFAGSSALLLGAGRAAPSAAADGPDRHLAHLRLEAGPPAALGGTMRFQATLVPMRDVPAAEVFFVFAGGLIPVGGITHRHVALQRDVPQAFELQTLLVEPGAQSVVAGVIGFQGQRRVGDVERLFLDVGLHSTRFVAAAGQATGQAAGEPMDLFTLAPLAPRPVAASLRCSGTTLPGPAGAAPGQFVACSVADAPADDRSVRLTAWLLGPAGVVGRADPLCAAPLDHGAAACDHGLDAGAPGWQGATLVSGTLLPSGRRFGPAMVLAEIEP